MKKNKSRSRVLMKILLIVSVFLCLLDGSVLIAGFTRASRLNDPLPDLKATYCEKNDTFAPGIELNGEAEISLKTGEVYEEPGVEIFEYCETNELETVSDVNTDEAGTYTVTYKISDKSGNTNEVSRTVIVKSPATGIIYLTFDDGPGPYTSALLDILAKYNVKATFFVTGAGSDDLILREYNEGHAVALHTMSHNYSYIYQNTDTFFADLYAVQERVKNITGYTSYLMRFPGGSSNTVSANYDGGTGIMTRLAAEVEARGFTYFDWNISSGDAGGATTTSQVYQNVVSRLIPDGSSVILQHDIKGFSVDAVESIIQYGLDNGYEFRKLDASSFTAHHGINN